MAYCSLEEAWGDSYKNTKHSSLPDRYTSSEERDTQSFSKKLRHSREKTSPRTKGFREGAHHPSPSVQGIIERTPPRTKKRKHSKKKKYFQRTMKRVPNTSGAEYRYNNNEPNLRVSARKSSPQLRHSEGKIQGFQENDASAYDSDSADDAFSHYHSYTSDTSTEDLSKFAGSLLGSRNLRNNRFLDTHLEEDKEEEEAVSHRRNPYIEEEDIPSSSPYHSSVSEDHSVEDEQYPHAHHIFDEDDEIEQYQNTQSENRSRKPSRRQTQLQSNTYRVQPDLTVIDNVQEAPLIDRLHKLNQIEEDRESESEEMMAPRLSTSKESMFNIILYLVTGVFIIFVLDIFVRLGKTFTKL